MTEGYLEELKSLAQAAMDLDLSPDTVEDDIDSARAYLKRFGPNSIMEILEYTCSLKHALDRVSNDYGTAVRIARDAFMPICDVIGMKWGDSLLLDAPPKASEFIKSVIEDGEVN